MKPKFVNQQMLHDLARDLDLSKEKSEVLGSRLKQWNLLQAEVYTTSFRRRHEEFSMYFKITGKHCYSCNVESLMEQLCKNRPYENGEWRLFIDSGKNTFKAVLLHQGNLLPSVLIVHAHEMSEA